MSYQVKRSIVSIVLGIIVLGAYCIYAYSNYQSGAIAANDLKTWASTMLVFIGIGIFATIVIQIVFHILLSVGIAVQEKLRNGTVDESTINKTIKAEMVTDEMDKLIELKSMRIGFVVAGIGFVAALVSLILNYSPVVMINIMFVSFSAGSIFEGFTQIYFYRTGV